MSFTEHNSCPMTLLDLAQYAVCVMSARLQSDKSPGFYMQTAPSFWNAFIFDLHHSVTLCHQQHQHSCCTCTKEQQCAVTLKVSEVWKSIPDY